MQTFIGTVIVSAAIICIVLAVIHFVDQRTRK